LFRDEAFYRKVVESSNLAMVVVGIDAAVRHHTRAAALMLTGTDTDLVGRLFPSLFTAGSQEGVDAFLRRVVAEQTEVTAMAATCCLLDGDERFIEITAVDLVDSPEVGGLVISLADRTEAHRALEIANRMANFDPLTGLFNRRAFDEYAHELFKDGVARPAFVAMFDVDGLKAFNDSLGHKVGDDVLRSVAERLSTTIGTAGTVARIGGDEFAVVLPDVNRETARRLLEAACQAIHEPIEGTDLRPTATCGVALSTMAHHWPGLMHRADAALYEAKKTKRGGVFFFRGDEPGWEQQRQHDREALLAAEQALVDLRSDVQRLEHENRHDKRTGLLNSAAFDVDLTSLHALATQEGTTYAIVLCDIDFFHNYNLRYLYQPANVTLRRVADAINAACRPGDLVYRYGGEEMVITLRHTALDEACEVGERVRAAVEALALPHDSRPDPHVVTISVGVAAANCTIGATAAGVVDTANRALIAAKGGGRNRVQGAM
jgi:diguanylate cyclase (GGDEF)-like protein/PAS domain S-box-containing protein